MIFLKIILFIFLAYLTFNVVYLLLFSIAGYLRKGTVYSQAKYKRKIAVLIPAYKEDNVIFETARQAILHNYPRHQFDVIVIADQLKENTLRQLSEKGVKVIPVSFAESTKARSIKYAINQLPDHDYDVVVILDADNVMEKGCLEKINHACEKGFKMIQLHRTAKNRNTATAILDAVSEEINNRIFRQGHRALGLSSALIGSGMAFDFSLFKEIINQDDEIESNIGEDREINIRFLHRGWVCEYIDDAHVYDEKVQSNQVMEKQRSRWLSAQLQYVKQFWWINPAKTLLSNKNSFDFALQTLLIPRSLLIGITLIMFILSLVSLETGLPFFLIASVWGLFLFPCLVLSLALSSMGSISAVEFKKAVLYFPGAAWSFFRAFLKSSPNQKGFVHTPKQFIKE